MTDQPTQADRERALAVARNCLELNIRISDIGAKAVSSTLLAIHAENERFRKVLEEFREHGDRDTRFYLGQVLDGAAAQEPKMTETQAETGPSDEGGANVKAFLDWMDQWAKEFPGRNPHIAEAFSAGRASLAGELAEAKQELTELRALYNANAMKRENDGPRAELEAEKAARQKAEANATRYYREAGEARQARVMPSREAIADASSDPPMPLPDVLPAGTRADAGGADVEATRDAFLEMNTVNGPCYWSKWSGGLGFIRARDIDWAHYHAQQARYVPSVGERVVLVASPDPRDGGYVGCTLTITGIDTSLCYRGVPAFHWHADDSSGDDTYIHRDATWRRAEPQGEATESDAAWLKRTVEELTTARPVEVIEDERGHLHVSTTGDGEAQLVSLRAYVDGRYVEGIRSILSGNRWPMRNARQVEPAAGVASPPRRFTTPAEALECLRETIAEECHQEHPAHEAIGALETIEALSKRVGAMEAHGQTYERRIDTELGRIHSRVGSGSKRLDEFELQGRVVKRMVVEPYIFNARADRPESAEERFARIEREERANPREGLAAHTSAEPPTKT